MHEGILIAFNFRYHCYIILIFKPNPPSKNNTGYSVIIHICTSIGRIHVTLCVGEGVHINMSGDEIGETPSFLALKVSGPASLKTSVLDIRVILSLIHTYTCNRWCLDGCASSYADDDGVCGYL